LASRATAGAVFVVLLFRATAFGGQPVAHRITDAADLLGGPAAQGEVGDFMLENGDIAIVIEDIDHPHGSGLTGGNVIDAGTGTDRRDELGQILTLLVEWPRQAVYDTVWVDRRAATGEAAIVARGSDSENSSIEVATRYSLHADERFLTIETTVTNTGESLEEYRAGDAVDWAAGEPFAPGYGSGLAGTVTFSEWIAAAGSPVSYGYTKASGNTYAEHGSGHSDAFVFFGDLASGCTASFTRYLAIGAHGLSSASDVVHSIRGQATGTFEGLVSDEATGAPVTGAAIDCAVNDVAPYTEILTDDSGGFSATLPPATYGLETTAPGYYDQWSSVSISAGDTTAATYVLRPTDWAPVSGDTLTVVMRPILSVPAIVTPGGDFTIEAEAPPSAAGWIARIRRGSLSYGVDVASASYSTDHERWFLTADVPTDVPCGMYDLIVEASGGITDTVGHSVSIQEPPEDGFYFVHITDTHLPTHLFSYEAGADTDTTEMDDLRAVIEDINIINPAFVLFTGDVVNEGELEDYLGWRVYTRAERLLSELEVPVYIVTGNHDVGGWQATPPPEGTARRTWWKFFGWPYLDSPPPGDGMYTQNYTFDYGGAHFIGMEAYINTWSYDHWRPEIYGDMSFTDRQMDWLAADLSLVDPSVPTILFFHYDFDHELDLEALGIDCALWGHVHYSSGSINERPFDLSTGCVCDGERWMRLVRVSGGALYPSEPVSAGENGERLRVSFDPANDGAAARVTATIVNDNPESYEHALIRFHVRADSMPYTTSIGSISETVVDGDVATCCVNVSIPFENRTLVTIYPAAAEPDTSQGATALLTRVHPNPARSGASIEFVLASPAHARLEIFDVSGRKVVTLFDGTAETGASRFTWDLRNDAGHGVASGVYFCRLTAAGESLTEKFVVVR